MSRTIATATEVRSEDLGTAFVGLNIAGQSIPSVVAPNTVVALPGLGSVTPRQHIAAANRSTSALTVDMIAIRITQENSYGLPAGTEITIGHASSSFKRTQPDVLYSGAVYATLALANVPSGLSAGSGMTGLVTVGAPARAA